MAAKNRKELKENELAGVLTDRLELMKPHLPKILLAFVGLAGVVFGINYFIASRSSAKEAKSISMILYAVEQSSAGSVSTLNKQIEDFPDDNTAAWAMLLKADSQLSQGLDAIFVDKTGSLEKIESSLQNFEAAGEKAGDDAMLRRRVLYGWAKGLESLGEFAEAAGKYEEIIKENPDSPFAELANFGLERVLDPANREFYAVFQAKDDNVFSVPTAPGETAPMTNSGLPARPDFTYPGEEPVPGIPDVSGGGSSFPTPPPVPPQSVVDPKEQPPAATKSVKETTGGKEGKVDGDSLDKGDKSDGPEGKDGAQTPKKPRPEPPSPPEKSKK